MYVDSFLRFVLAGFVALALTACGGGGGGGGGDNILSPGGGSGGSGAATGTISLSISGMVDASGSEDNVLAGNETATLTATARENGSSGDLVVVFESTGGTLVETSAQTSGGEASVQIIGDGNAGAITVTATVTLSDGTEISDAITVQTSADAPSLSLQVGGAEPDSIDLLSGESAQVTAVVTDWNGTPLSGIGVSFSATAVDLDVDSGVSSGSGQVIVTLTGQAAQKSGTLSASATFNSFDLSDSVAANSLGLDTANNNVVLDPIDVGTDGVLSGNEKITIVARVTQDGVARDGISVTFSSTNGTLVPDSATSTGGGIASVQLIGTGVAGVADVTASATFGGGATVSDTQTVQTSSVKPTLDLVVRNQNGVAVTEFGANEELTVEATVRDYDGTALDADDAGVPVVFDLGGTATANSNSDLTTFEACPVVGIKAQADCAFIEAISGDTPGVGTITATGTINGIEITDSVTVNNTGTNSGSPDQNSFALTRIVGGSAMAEVDTVAIEGDDYDNQTATLRVQMADFFNNPVPDGTVVDFTTELGDIDPSCEIASGFCEVTFRSGEPRSPTNSEVSFNDLDINNCPSAYIEDEVVTINSAGNGLTDYRVDDVLRVRINNTSTVLAKNTAYAVTSNGIDCITCLAGQVVQITYRRLWLDEENDGSTAHVLLNPGVASEPFLETSGMPCLAPSRTNKIEISGSINPAAATAVAGVGTSFRRELAVGDRLKVNDEVRTVATIASNTSLTVDVAFSDTGNDTSPERLAAPAYLGGMGQPYGGRATILAYAVGEESFVDTNGNSEYDFGETFVDLPEAFIDKNEDGVLGDNEGDSAVAGITGPYRDAGLGAAAPGEAREKSNPYCYGPETITGNAGDGDDSTENQKYCYQDGGEEELFIDANGNGVMDIGNGIYNGSRCLTPLQDADGDGQADDVVCTTDLVNISKQTQILLAGSAARTSFRALGANGEGGTDGAGEIIAGIANKAGLAFTESLGNPSSWTDLAPAAVPDVVTLSDNLSGFPFGGVVIDTFGLDAGGGIADDDEEVSLFSISNPFSTTQATYTLNMSVIDSSAVGVIDVYVGSTKVGSCPVNADGPCPAIIFAISATGDLVFVVGDDGGDFRVQSTIGEIVLTGVTTGITNDFQSTENLVSNSRTVTTLKDFNVGTTIDATTVFPGASERKAASGVVPTITTSRRSGTFWFTDRYNGQLPDGTTVKIESDDTVGCELVSVGGVAVTGGSRTVTVGSEVSTGVSFSVTAGGGGAGAVIATVTTPVGNTTSDSISCNLFQ